MFRWFTSIVMIVTVAGVASAQQAIVELKVMPEKSVFKDAKWNKPIVIKSADDVAMHFGKDAQDAIAKAVDFKKQIVLVFAWQGSGGDKLEYKILESFPEQVPFSMQLVLTRDLRQHSRVFAIRSNVKWSVPGEKGK